MGKQQSYNWVKQLSVPNVKGKSSCSLIPILYISSELGFLCPYMAVLKVEALFFYFSMFADISKILTLNSICIWIRVKLWYKHWITLYWGSCQKSDSVYPLNWGLGQIKKYSCFLLPDQPLFYLVTLIDCIWSCVDR